MKKWLVAFMAAALLMGCATGQKPIPQQPPGERLIANVFRCPDGFQFAVKWTWEAERAEIILPNATAFLNRDASASGARYTASQMEFWNKGDEAYLKVYDREHRGCREDQRQSLVMDARYRGVSFRGAGNEPPWILEMGPKMMVLITGYERNSHIFPLSRPPKSPSEDQPAPDIRQDAATVDHRIRVEASPADCRDTMSGEAAPYRVRIDIDNQILRGCGGWLPPPPE